jgi:hypothetical protein
LAQDLLVGSFAALPDHPPHGTDRADHPALVEGGETLTYSGSPRSWIASSLPCSAIACML